MGTIEFGIPKKITVFFMNEFKITNFVETGTYMGGTSLWAADVFENVYTVENSKKIYGKYTERLKTKKNIESFFGNSKLFLEKIKDSITKPTIFWLDAHWSGGDTYGMKDECPLIKEIDVINSYKVDTFVLIDDARLFLSPPPQPHSAEQWPQISEVINRLGNKRFTVVVDDVIISVPLKYKSKFILYLQNEYYPYLKKNDGFIKNIQMDMMKYFSFIFKFFRNIFNLSFNIR